MYFMDLINMPCILICINKNPQCILQVKEHKTRSNYGATQIVLEEKEAEWMDVFVRCGPPLTLDLSHSSVDPTLLFLNRKCGKVNTTKILSELKENARVSGELTATNVQETIVTKVFSCHTISNHWT